jgi:steroid delta-isomerase-like uncharacterized protein
MFTYDPFRITAAHQEFWNNNTINPLKELLAPQATFRLVYEQEERPTIKAMEESLKLFREAFPDLRFTHTNIIPTEATLVVEWVATGTHKGKFQEILPTGKIVEMRGTNLFKLNEDGKIVKETAYFDLSHLLTLLGVVPAAIEEPRVRDLVNLCIEGMNRHDINMLAPLFTPDHIAVFTDGLILRGKEHLQYLQQNFIAFPDMKLELRELAIRNNEVVMLYRITGKHEGPINTIPATHKQVEFETCMVTTLEGDRIARINYYPDRFTMLREIKAVPELTLTR